MKDTALALLKIAASLFPPLADLIRSALDAAPAPAGLDERLLADEVRAVLPVESESAKAARKIGGSP